MPRRIQAVLDARGGGIRYEDNRSPVETTEIVIDKMKLLEIAKANALKAIKEGTLYLNMTPSDISSLERKLASNRSVEEFTHLCEEISKREDEEDEFQRIMADDDDAGEDSNDESGFTRHPFRLRDAAMIMNIRNSIARPTQPFRPFVPPKSVTQDFPVSSGQQHRKKEQEIDKAVEAGQKADEIVGSANVDFPCIDKLPPVAEIVKSKVYAQRSLKTNPNDWSSQLQLHKAEQQLQTWAQASPVPGMFTGTTGATVLTPHELECQSQLVWARKDMFHNLRPIREGYGMRILIKMGWKPGQPMGLSQVGAMEPIAVEVKSDRKGLASFDEKILVKKTGVANLSGTIPSVNGRHPVTALIEYCKRFNHGPPEFNLLYEGGADHRKIFQMKVRIGTTEYQPSITSPNKREAKAVAALAALQALGITADVSSR